MHYLTMFIAFIPFFASSQVWIEENAVWHYDYWNIGTGGFYKMEYTQDTVVGGTICQQIETKKYIFTSDQSGTIQFSDSVELDPQSTYTAGDTVFYWNDDQFFTLFNFGATIGDQWIIGVTNPLSVGPCSDTSRVEVVNTGTVTINSVNYRTITLATLDSSSIGLSGVFVERFGFLDDNQPFLPFPRTMNCDGAIVEYDIVSFKCFEDDALPLHNPSGEDCEYFLTHLNISEHSTTKTAVYPNPFHDFIEVRELVGGTLTVYNAAGNVVVSTSSSSHEKIDLSYLENGVYILAFSDDSGSFFHQRVLKQ